MDQGQAGPMILSDYYQRTRMCSAPQRVQSGLATATYPSPDYKHESSRGKDRPADRRTSPHSGNPSIPYRLSVSDSHKDRSQTMQPGYRMDQKPRPAPNRGDPANSKSWFPVLRCTLLPGNMNVQFFLDLSTRKAIG